MQKHVNLVDLVKSFRTNILLQNLASIQKRTSPIKFAHLAEKSGKGSMSNLSTKTRSSVWCCPSSLHSPLSRSAILGGVKRPIIAPTWEIWTLHAAPMVHTKCVASKEGLPGVDFGTPRCSGPAIYISPTLGICNNNRILYTESGQTLRGSFSAVSKPKFASK